MKRSSIELLSGLGTAFLALLLTPLTLNLSAVPERFEELSLYTFAVAGAIAALILPAAGLIGQLVTKLIDFSAHRVFGEGVDDSIAKTRARTYMRILRAAQRHGWAAWRGSVYILASVLVVLISLFIPVASESAPLQSCAAVFLALALALLAAGLISLLLPTYWLYEFETLKVQLQLLEAAGLPVQGEAEEIVEGVDKK